MRTYIICTRCGRPMRPMYSDGTGAPTNGYCQCAPATSWGDVPLLDWRDAELSRLRMQVEQMRIDAIKDREAFAAKLVIEAGTLRADLAEARAELEQAKADVERWAGSSGFYSESLLMANESNQVLQAERDTYAAALVEIRGICTAMMDGWGQTVTVLDKIRKITLTAIKRQPTEPPHRPETFA